MIVGILGVSTSPVAVRLKLLPCFLEWVGNVLEENEPEHDVFGLGGVHVTAERVGHAPQLSLIANQSPMFNVLLGRQVEMPSREMRLRKWQTLYRTLPFFAPWAGPALRRKRGLAAERRQNGRVANEVCHR